MMRRVILATLLLAAPALANDAPYAGLDGRDIASLSSDDITALEAGAGWGLALPAELNGWPGPRHVLDLADELQLTEDQKANLQDIFDGMNAAARATGAQLIAAERALDAAFESGDLDRPALAEMLAQAETARAELRGIHLQAHLETKPLLTRHQTVLYAQARGYGAGDHSQGGHGDH
ncbi:hypothetical protein AIOL_000648 [Candidatus Rhodobacter oscarellae]|uniref:Zinc resistance-associated protein n=1 Tax=Candidatus Rhodobacter oscarellae TaxID=1675527 RepID=A0A0J9ECI9_9RHOB|nr:periplasmic heavy metal sensor [Candidatus Rhodobacter lobularis]KMW60492.1 hypothetical protein AIOL_000648 [Candidatus Rhodobacter lobularis]